MGQVLKESAITTRNARSNLPVGLHWRGIDEQVHLGYRKKKRGGAWLVRWRSGTGYRQAPVGIADDTLAEGTLSYEAAVRAARAIVEASRAEARIAAQGAPLTVRSAVEAYITERDARDSRRAGRAVRSDAGRRLGLHLLGRPAVRKRQAVTAAPLADVELHRLTEQALRDWRNTLPDTLKPATRQRLVNDLRAALNSARADPAIVKNGLKAAKLDEDESVPLARENQILEDRAISALIRAAREVDADLEWHGDLYRLVVTLAATGARFSQAVRMRVGDVQKAQGRLMVPVSRKGRGGKSGSIPVPVGKDVVDALLPAVTGRPADAPLLERWRRKQKPGSVGKWVRAGRGPWQSASELARPWHDIRDRAKMPGVIAYALRHSSIVRGIRANLPIRLVAALHDTSVPMIERHYGRWVADGLEDIAARAIVPLVPADDDGQVVRFGR